MKNIYDTVLAFRTAVLAQDTDALIELLHDDLTYGHSDGHVEGKKDFIRKLGDGTYRFLTMDLSNEAVIEHDSLAIVRHELDAETNDEGNRGEAHLYVLLVWNLENGRWRLIARQAVKKINR